MPTTNGNAKVTRVLRVCAKKCVKNTYTIAVVFDLIKFALKFLITTNKSPTSTSESSIKSAEAAVKRRRVCIVDRKKSTLIRQVLF